MKQIGCSEQEYLQNPLRPLFEQALQQRDSEKQKLKEKKFEFDHLEYQNLILNKDLNKLLSYTRTIMIYKRVNLSKQIFKFRDLKGY